MKLPLVLLAAALGLSAADMGEVKAVYLLPMGNALDQFLATRLTTGNVVQVVTDPQRADAILSDRIGAGLDERLDEIYGAKPIEGNSKGDFSRPAGQPVSHARGTIFLIDRKTRNILWSVYERPKSISPDDLNHLAEKVAAKLSKDLKGK